MSCCRTVDSGVEKPGMAGDNSGLPVGGRWTRRRPPCGRIRCPHPVEEGWPQIHMRLTSSDAPSVHRPVDPTGITFPSPGCGRKILAQSVERGRVPPRNRTQQARSTGLGRRRGVSECGVGGSKRGRERCVARSDAPDGSAQDAAERSGRGGEQPGAAVLLGRSPGGGPRTAKGAPGADPGAPWASCGPASAVLDAVGQLGDLVVDRTPLGHQRADLAVGVHHGRMVPAAELRADLRQ